MLAYLQYAMVIVGISESEGNSYVEKHICISIDTRFHRPNTQHQASPLAALDICYSHDDRMFRLGKGERNTDDCADERTIVGYHCKLDTYRSQLFSGILATIKQSAS